MGWPWSSPQTDIQLPNEGGRSPQNPARELGPRRAAAKAAQPDVPGAFKQAAEGFKALSDKGLVGKRSQSNGRR